MQNILITSLNFETYHQYGRRFLLEFEKNTSEDLKLYVYFVGAKPNEAENSKKIFFFNFENKLHQEFLNKYKKFYEANGLRVNINIKGTDKIISLKVDQRFNAFKYSIRPFTILACLNDISNETTNLIWIDSDLRCKKFFSSNDLNELLPDNNQILSYIGGNLDNSDFGFMAFNIKHKRFNEFLQKVLSNYITGKIFSYPEWHDTFLWEITIKEFLNLDVSVIKNLVANPDINGHLYLKTKMGEFFDHLKGKKRKELGRSSEEDYL